MAVKSEPVAATVGDGAAGKSTVDACIADARTLFRQRVCVRAYLRYDVGGRIYAYDVIGGGAYAATQFPLMAVEIRSRNRGGRTFVLHEPEPGVTRLIVRARGGPAYRFHGLPLALTRLAIRIVHFFMERKQLLGIARRAETGPCPAIAPVLAQTTSPL